MKIVNSLLKRQQSNRLCFFGYWLSILKPFNGRVVLDGPYHLSVPEGTENACEKTQKTLVLERMRSQKRRGYKGWVVYAKHRKDAFGGPDHPFASNQFTLYPAWAGGQS